MKREHLVWYWESQGHVLGVHKVEELQTVEGADLTNYPTTHLVSPLHGRVCGFQFSLFNHPRAHKKNGEVICSVLRDCQEKKEILCVLCTWLYTYIIKAVNACEFNLLPLYIITFPLIFENNQLYSRQMNSNKFLAIFILAKSFCNEFLKVFSKVVELKEGFTRNVLKIRV